MYAGDIQTRTFVTPEHLDLSSQLGHSIAGRAAPRHAPSTPTHPIQQTLPLNPCEPRSTPLSTQSSAARQQQLGAHVQPTAAKSHASGAEGEEASVAGALKGQLAPKATDCPGPSLSEAFSKLERLDRAAAIAGALPLPAFPLYRTGNTVPDIATRYIG